ncbi:MAG: nucleotidyltransferase [Thermoproteus sp.]
MDALRRVAEASSEGPLWRAYVAARHVVEVAARAVVEMGLPRPARCEDLPRVLAGALLDAADAAKLAEVVKAAKAIHRVRDRAYAEKIAEDAVKLLEKLIRGVKRRYPDLRTSEGFRYALKAARVKAAYSLGPNTVAVRPEKPLSVEERMRLAVDLSTELGIPPEKLVVADASEPGVLEELVRTGRLLYADDLDEEIKWLAERYMEYICC